MWEQIDRMRGTAGKQRTRETLNVQGIEQPHQQAGKTCLDLSVSVSRSSHFLLIDGFCSPGAAHLNDSCACFLHASKSRTEARPCPSITMTYRGQICWRHVFVCVFVCVQRRGRGGQTPPKITWKKRDNPFFGIFLPSLDWELVENLHLWEDTRNTSCKRFNFLWWCNLDWWIQFTNNMFWFSVLGKTHEAKCCLCLMKNVMISV